MTGGEQISLIGKFFTAKQEEAQDPHAFYQQFMSVVSNLEMAFDQPIPKMLVHARFLDALLPEYEVQKQHLLSQKTLETDEVMRVLRTRVGYLKVEKGGGDTKQESSSRRVEKGRTAGEKGSSRNRKGRSSRADKTFPRRNRRRPRERTIFGVSSASLMGTCPTNALSNVVKGVVGKDTMSRVARRP